MNRREFLGASLGASAALMWKPIGKILPGAPEAGAVPDGFPSIVPLSKQLYENWALEVHVDDVWTAEPTTTAGLVAVANWASAHGWRVRPSGMKHNWAPYNVVPWQTEEHKVVLMDMTTFDGISVDKQAKTVTAGAGALMDDIMLALESNGLGMSSIPAPGAITIGGVLAIDGHGAALPAAGENATGHSFGSMSNRVLSMQIVGWDATSNSYKLLTIDRSDPRAKALLTALGRIFLVSVTLRAETNVNLRCVSFTDVTADEVFAHPSKTGLRTFASYVAKTGRVEAILFPFTERPWMKTWEVAPTKPASSRAVKDSYNYPFSDTIPLPIARLTKLAITTQPSAAIELGAISLAVSDAGLAATNSKDLWGPSRRTQHYIKASTIRATALSHAVLTSRANIQRVVHEYVAKHRELVAAYKARGLYPSNMPLEIRCTGVERAADVGVAGAETPSLSAMSPHPDHPEWDTVVFLSALSLVGSAGLYEFGRDFEQWIFGNYSGNYALARGEWSKAWAATSEAFWVNSDVLENKIPASLPGWTPALQILRQLDPHKLFGNDFHDRLTG